MMESSKSMVTLPDESDLVIAISKKSFKFNEKSSYKTFPRSPTCLWPIRSNLLPCFVSIQWWKKTEKEWNKLVPYGFQWSPAWEQFHWPSGKANMCTWNPWYLVLGIKFFNIPVTRTGARWTSFWVNVMVPIETELESICKSALATHVFIGDTSMKNITELCCPIRSETSQCHTISYLWQREWKLAIKNWI
jgi:hypothetical protein